MGHRESISMQERMSSKKSGSLMVDGWWLMADILASNECKQHLNKRMVNSCESGATYDQSYSLLQPISADRHKTQTEEKNRMRLIFGGFLTLVFRLHPPPPSPEISTSVSALVSWFSLCFSDSGTVDRSQHGSLLGSRKETYSRWEVNIFSPCNSIL